MNKTESLKFYLKKILEGKTIDECLKHLRYVLKKSKNEFISLNNRFNHLEKEKNQGTISFENENIERSKIRESLIEFIDELEKEDLKNIWDFVKKAKIL